MKKHEKDAVNAMAVTIIESFAENEPIPHSYFYKMFGIELPNMRDYENNEDYAKAFQEMQFKYLNCIENLRDTLIQNHKVHLKNDIGAGYHLMEPNDQIQYGIEHTKAEVKKSIRQGTKLVTNVDNHRVKSDVRRKASDQIARWSMIRGIA